MGEWVLLDREDYEDEIARLRREVKTATDLAVQRGFDAIKAQAQLQRVREAVDKAGACAAQKIGIDPCPCLLCELRAAMADEGEK